MTETLMLAEAKKYSELESFIAGWYLPVTIPDDIWDLVATIRRELRPTRLIKGLRSRTWSSQRRPFGSS